MTASLEHGLSLIDFHKIYTANSPFRHDLRKFRVKSVLNPGDRIPFPF